MGLFSILILWMYANFWITGALFVVGGMILFLHPITTDVNVCLRVARTQVHEAYQNKHACMYMLKT